MSAKRYTPGALPEPWAFNLYHRGIHCFAYSGAQVGAYAASEVARATAAEREHCARLVELHAPSNQSEAKLLAALAQKIRDGGEGP